MDEVVDICRDLIRIDTTNDGSDDGPGERKAAEYVAGLLEEVGIETRLYESTPRPHLPLRALGRGRDPRRRAAAARAPRRRAGGGGGLDRASVQRRGAGRLRVGPRRGRHEGLRRDAAGRRPRPPAVRPDPGPADGAVLHRRRGGRRPSRRRGDGARPPGGVRGLHRGGRRGRRVEHDGPRAPDLPDRVRREGHGLDAADRPRDGRPRLDDQPRQRGVPDRRGGGADRRLRVAGPADPDHAHACSAPSARWPAPT